MGRQRSVRRGTWIAPTLAVLLIAGVCSGSFIVGSGFSATPAAAVPGNPGVPGPVTVVYVEDFENGGTQAMQSLAEYPPRDTVSGEDVTLSASPYWTNIRACNGIVLAGNSPGTIFPIGATPSTTTCGLGPTEPADGPHPSLRRLATLLGNGNAANHALSSYTHNSVVAPVGETIQLQTSATIPVTPGRYYGASVDYAVANCFAAFDPLPQFFILQGGTEVSLGAEQNACGTYTGRDDVLETITSLGAVRIPAGVTTVGLRLRNNQRLADGNDSAIDNLTLADVTPQLDKAFSPATIAQGETSTLTFTITNREDLAAKTDWSFTDNLPTGLVVAPTPAVGGTCTQRAGANFTVTATPGSDQIQVANGDLQLNEVSCTITVAVRAVTPGTFTNGPSNITPSSGLDLPGTSTLTVHPVVDLGITKATVDGGGTLGSYTPGLPITYRVVVTNAASTSAAPVSTATGLVFTDLVPAAVQGVTWACAPGVGASCATTSGTTNTVSTTLTIPAGGQVTFTIQGTVAPGTTGQLVNTARVVPPQTTNVPGVGPLPTVERGGDCPPAPGAGCSATVSTPGSRLAVTKSHSPATLTAAGTSVVYTFAVTNTGEAPLTGVTVSDVFTAGGNGTAGAITCVSRTSPAGACSGTSTTLAPGQSATFTMTYTVDQADVDLGRLANTATATGTPPAGPAVTATAIDQLPATQGPDLALLKTASPTSVSSVGQLVTYTFVARNVGNVTLSGVTITDPMPGLSALDCTPAVPVSLAPNASVSCTATRAATQADLNAGTISNTATATGQPPTGDPVTDTSTAVVTAAQEPGIELTKSADRTATIPGEIITYTFQVENTGNVTLTDVVVRDPLAGLSPLTCDPTAPTTLEPGDQLSCTATYEVTTQDATAGQVRNRATVTGERPGGDPEDPADDVTDEDEVEVLADPTPAPGLQLVKTASTSEVRAVGAVITYTLVATNTGNTELNDVVIRDDKPGVSELDCVQPQPTTLLPGEAQRCTATYTTTAADLAAGSVVNAAAVTGTPPGGTPISGQDQVRVPTIPRREPPADPPWRPLPRTGAEVGGLVLLAGGLLTGGFLFLFGGRRRRGNGGASA